MANRIYSQVQLLCEVSDKYDLVNKKYVDDAISARVLAGVSCVVVDPITGNYEPTDMVLTQTGGSVNSDGVTLTKGMEFLYATKTGDTTLNGIWVVETAPVEGSTTPSTAVAKVTSTGGIVSATVDKTVFETKVTTSGTYTFTYSLTDTSWMFEGKAISLSDYGIVESGSVQDADIIEVTYVQEVTTPATMGVFKRSERMSKSSQFNNGQLIPVWEGLIYGNSIFTLTTDEAITLDTTPINYEKYKGSEEGAKKYKETIVGNDVATTWTITHGLGTKDVDVNIYDNATGEKVYFGVNIVSENAIEIISGVVLTPDDKFDVVVIG